jgi:hypothetical protein
MVSRRTLLTARRERAHRLSACWDPILRDNHRDVVAAACAVGQFDQRRTLLARFAPQREHFGKLGVVEHVGQPIGAQQHAIAILQLKAVDLDQRMCSGGADCIGQDMTQILGAALDRGRTLGIGEVLLDGVIARQAL